MNERKDLGNLLSSNNPSKPLKDPIGLTKCMREREFKSTDFCISSLCHPAMKDDS